MISSTILIIIGFILLSKGADFLVDGASEIAKKFHIPEIVIGLTIVAVGTSMPELVVSVTSSIQGHSDIAIGNIVGSNIANMFFILGICSIIKPLKFKKETRVFEMPFTIIVTIILFIMCINGKEEVITQGEGVCLLIICVGFILYNLAISKMTETIDNTEKIIEITIGKSEEIKWYESFFKIIIGILFLKVGGDFVVNNCVIVARLLGITEQMISLTIVAFSTSLPELITSIVATKKNQTDIAIGNILGSQIFNIVLIIGVSAALNPINYSALYNSNIILLIAGSFLMWIFPYIGRKNRKIRNEMTRADGILFVVTYIIYLIQVVRCK